MPNNEDRITPKLAITLILCAMAIGAALTWWQDRHYHTPDIEDMRGATKHQGVQEVEK